MKCFKLNFLISSSTDVDTEIGEVVAYRSQMELVRARMVFLSGTLLIAIHIVVIEDFLDGVVGIEENRTVREAVGRLSGFGDARRNVGHEVLVMHNSV